MPHKSLWSRGTEVSAVFCSLAAAGGAYAQSAGAASSDEVQEIVVTATRSATELQKTPVALNVYTPSQLQEAGVHNMDSLQSIDPTINITKNSGSPYIAIRGITSTNTTEVGNPAVSLARDGFFVNRSYSINTSFYDVERIEVLKGPQGTLFGRNSTGGLINVITAAPNHSSGGYLSMEAGDYKLIGGEGAVNVPLAEQLDLRISGFFRSHEGYRRVTGPGIDFRGDDDRSASGRAQLLWKPVDVFSLLLSYQADHLGGNGDVAAIVPLGVPFDVKQLDKGIPGYQPSELSLSASRTRWVATVEQLPFNSTFTYSGGVDVEHFHRAQDASTVFASPDTAASLAQFVQNEHPTTWNHEIRVATPTDGPFTLQMGAFYFSESNDPLHSYQVQQSGPYVGNNLIAFDYQVKNISRAVFGQFGYNILPNLQLTGGTRYTSESLRRVGSNSLRCDVAGIPPSMWGALGCLGTLPTMTNSADGAMTESKPTYHVGLQWNVTDTNMLYAKYDTGFKSGGFNVQPGTPGVPYGPETVKSAEIGSKNTFFNRRAIVNFDIFDERFIGYHANVPMPLFGTGASGIVNFGSARIRGAELSVQARVSDADRIDLSGTFMHARFGDNLQPVENLAQNGTVDISGNNLPNAPAVVLTGGIEHDFLFGENKLTLRVSGKYSSKFYFDLYNLPDTTSPAYATGDATLTYIPADSRWKATFFVRNFSDQVVFSRAVEDLIGNVNQYEFMPPRTFGVQLSWKY